MPRTRDGNQIRGVDKRISGRSISTLVLYCVTSDFKRTVTGLCSGQIDKKLCLFPPPFFPPASWFLEISSIFHWVTVKSGTLPPPLLPLVPVLPRVLETSSGIRNKIYDAACISFGLSLHLRQSHWHQTQDHLEPPPSFKHTCMYLWFAKLNLIKFALRTMVLLSFGPRRAVGLQFNYFSNVSLGKKNNCSLQVRSQP